MPTKGRDPDYLVGTSVAVALAVTDHPGHKTVFDALGGRRLGLSGHAAFETYSVLTRLPAPALRTAAAASRLIEVNFPQSGRACLGRARKQRLGRLVELGHVCRVRVGPKGGMELAAAGGEAMYVRSVRGIVAAAVGRLMVRP